MEFLTWDGEDEYEEKEADDDDVDDVDDDIDGRRRLSGGGRTAPSQWLYRERAEALQSSAKKAIKEAIENAVAAAALSCWLASLSFLYSNKGSWGMAVVIIVVKWCQGRDSCVRWKVL